MLLVLVLLVLVLLVLVLLVLLLLVLVLLVLVLELSDIGYLVYTLVGINDVCIDLN